MTTVTAIILAGGKSSRMGRDKALISLQGKPFIMKIYQVANECASQVYVISPWNERYQSILPKTCQMIPEKVSPETTKPPGPLIAFSQALKQVKTEWVLLLACDLPNLNSQELQRWCQELAKVPEEAIAFLPRSDQGWEPLCGFYRSSCLTALNEFISQGGKSFQGWLNQHFIQEISVTDPQIFYNCNTPEDIPPTY